MWFSRKIGPFLEGITSSFPAVILTGGRQVGKTSLFTKLFPAHTFVTLDLPSHAELAEKQPEEFLRRYPPPVVIDEVQYAPGLFRYLKVWIDKNRTTYGQFLLTGSQKFTLMNNVSESLAGRCAVVELETLSLDEVQSQIPITSLQMILRGGFPELHQRPELDHRIFYQSYLATYLERDVRTLLSVVHLRDFERFLRACALRNAQLLNKADLARDIGISPPTANQWLSVLNASNQIQFLEPWFRNGTKSLVKSPKLYFSDTGLLCFLLGITTEDELLRSPLLGSIWESFVFSEIRKKMIAERGRWDLWFWRDLRGLEADFLIHHGGNFELIEAKLSEMPGPRDVNALNKVAETLGHKNVQKKTVICQTSHSYPIDNNIMAMNLEEFHKLC